MFLLQHHGLLTARILGEKDFKDKKLGKPAETKTTTRDPAEGKKCFFAEDSVRLPDAFRSHCDKRKTKVLRLLKLSFQVGGFVPSGAENNIRPFAWCGVRFAYFDSQSPLGAATSPQQGK